LFHPRKNSPVAEVFFIMKLMGQSTTNPLKNHQFRQTTIGFPKNLPQKFTERGLSSPTALGWEFNLGQKKGMEKPKKPAAQKIQKSCSTMLETHLQ